MSPLYTQEDAAQALHQFMPVKLHAPQLLAVRRRRRALLSTTFDAGHMLGSTCVLIEAREKGQTTRLLFSGDVGRKSLPIIRDPETRAGRGLPDHGEHLREPAASADRAGEEEAGEPGESHGASAAAISSCRPLPWDARSRW